MTSQLPAYKTDFLQAAIKGGVLKFGTFELKSGRISPYFFNAGLFHTSSLVQALADAFARTILDATATLGLDFDVVFGPAYKGIPLATITVYRLGALDPARYADLAFSFDRKEAKDHGEGGSIVGAPLRGRKVLIVDDVVTAGTAKREAIDKIRREGGEVAGIVVALDRMETLVAPGGEGEGSEAGKEMPSAIGALRKEYGFPIFSILTLDDIIEGTKEFATEEDVRRIEEYRRKYKASA